MKRDTILIVDDMEVNRAILRNLFESEYNILEAENGEQAILLLKQYHESLSALLLDLIMPLKDGYQVMKEMSEYGYMDRVPVVIITSENTMENEVKAFDMGATDIILKPFEIHVVKRRVRNAIELNQHKLHLEDMVEAQAIKLRESNEILIDTLSSIIEHRSIETGQHVLRIRKFTKVLLEDIMMSYPEYDLNEQKIGVISSAASLHDIGKISIPDAILNKPESLTRDEFNIMKTHSIKGCEILAGLNRMDDKEFLRYAYNICRYHHERWDGNGYPDGLKGDNIPICAQAVSIADCYDALTTDRVYKKAISPERAITMILNGECGCFSYRMLESLKNVKEEFAHLTRNYADGQTVSLASQTQQSKGFSRQEESDRKMELAQMKYVSLLRYVNATVMEIDHTSGVYHIVYMNNDDFKMFRNELSYKEAIHAFIQHSIKPDDKEYMEHFLSSAIEDLMESGVQKESRNCRIYHQSSGTYQWYEVCVLRIHMDDPGIHKFLLVFKDIDKIEPMLHDEHEIIQHTMMRNLQIGIQQCRNDAYFTMTDMNEGFITLFGYSKEEIKERFHNRYIEMILLEDREHVRRQFEHQYQKGNSMEIEYRVKTKSGEILWILDKCQVITGKHSQDYLNCVLMDITQNRKAQEELRLTMERHQIIMDQSNDIIFEWDICKDKLFFSSNWKKKFGYDPIEEHISINIPTASHIMPDDMPHFLDLMHRIADGDLYGEAEIRIAKANGRYTWIRIRATTQFDQHGKAVKAVGVLIDIDDERRKTEKLMEKAERDALTNLYNKNAARRKIQDLMSQDHQQSGIMMILDLDNFKLINDFYGHMFGDALLSEIAAQLKASFSNDIVARIGGDEFLIYVMSGQDMQLEKRIRFLLEEFHERFSYEMKDRTLSCSIGIAEYPRHGQEYQELFQHCDLALYHAKQHGKNRYVFYDEKTMSKTFGVDTDQIIAASTRIDSDEAKSFEEDDIVIQAFRLLYESGNVEAAVNAILELVGKKYDVSRVYIFEDSLDGTYSTNTFEWCGDGIEPEIDHLQKVLYEDLGPYQDNFDENDIFYCRDVAKLPESMFQVLAPQGICSMLQCAIRDAGKFVGYVGFDDCREYRLWTQNQINALTFISELLSTFLLKKRAQDRAILAAENLKMLLDHQNSWIYVIDPDTFELHYINEKTKRIAPQSKLGMRCHEAFFERTEACVDCPVKDIRNKINATIEKYNPVLKVWSSADASYIKWENKDACLLCCHDITAYKKGRK